MKILHLTDNYPPTMGGLEWFVQSLANVQARAGHSVTVVSTESDGEEAHSEANDVNVIRLPFMLRKLPGAFKGDQRVFFPPVPDPFFERKLSKVMSLDPPDVVHVHGWILYSALRPARRLGAAVVATAHDYGTVCAIKTLFPKGDVCSGPGWTKCVKCAHGAYGPKGIPIALGLHLASYRHTQVDEWMAPSSAVAAAGSAVRPKDRRDMTIVPCFAPDSVLSADPGAPRPDFVPQSGPYLLYAGALGIHKGIDVLLAAHRHMWNDGCRIPLTIAGIAVPDQEFDFGQPGVAVARNVPHKEVMAGWVNAAVGVVPSSWGEPFGQVALECLAAGTPLVVTRVGGLPDVVDHGACGLVVEPQDPVQLARAIRQALDDPDLARELGEAGRKRAQMYTSTMVYEKVSGVYRRAMEHHHANGGARILQDGTEHREPT
jgi:glycogen(starch) synthase